MTRQAPLARGTLATTITTNNGAPSGAVGLLMSSLRTGGFGQKLHELEILVSGSGALTFDGLLWGLADSGSVWSLLGFAPNRGHINNGVAITGTGSIAWRDAIKNLGQLGRVYLQVDNRGGTSFSLGATLTPIEES